MLGLLDNYLQQPSQSAANCFWRAVLVASGQVDAYNQTGNVSQVLSSTTFSIEAARQPLCGHRKAAAPSRRMCPRQSVAWKPPLSL